MQTNAEITVWHYDDATERYTLSHHFKVWLVESQKRNTEKGGETLQRKVQIRIPTKNKLDIHIGDYVRIGRFADAAPSRAADLKVTEIADNCRGGCPHWRLCCE